MVDCEQFEVGDEQNTDTHREQCDLISRLSILTLLEWSKNAVERAYN
jgi:hypothetical protein